MRPWIEQLPDRLQFELDEFARRGLTFRPDERELRKHSRLVLHGRLGDDYEGVKVTVVYPDSFPYLRPEVYAPGLSLRRHQNPFSGNLCLLDRSSRAWNTTDTGAWLIAERLPHLLALLSAGGEALQAGEVPQGEPLTSFLSTATGATMFVCQEVLEVPESVMGGTLRLGLGMQRPVGRQLRAALLSVAAGRQDPQAKPWRSKPPSRAIANRFQMSELKGVWVRMRSLPETRNPNEIVEMVRQIDPQAADPRWTPAADGQISVLGILVPEEVRQGEIEHNWLFVIRLRPPAGLRHPGQAYLLRGERLSPNDLQQRIPALNGFSGKTVSLAGLGSIGGTLAMELARAQVGTLRMLDMDNVEAGNVVRWPFGLAAVGHAKSEYLAHQIGVEYPFTNATAVSQHIGDACLRRPAQTQSEAATISAFIEGSDLILDATAELGVTQLLADLAASSGMGLLSVWATEGGWGGAVAELPPNSAGCWYCLQLHLADGSIAAPPAEPNSNVQPRGCAAPTFTASSFDMLEIVAQTMRSTRRMLLDSPSESMIHVCATRYPDGGERLAPLWASQPLVLHPECPCCLSTVAA